MQQTETPDYAVFARHHLARHNGGSITQFLRDLAEGEPANVTAVFPHITNSNQLCTQAGNVQRELGVVIRVRTFGDVVWACRLKADDRLK